LARRRGNFATVRQGQRRSTVWLQSAVATAPTALAASTIALDSSFTAAQFLTFGVPGTVVRTRGELWVRSDQDAANEIPFGAIGFHVANENARAAGAGSLLRPVTDGSDDLWFVHQYFLGGSFGASTGALFANQWHRYQFDSKAMRKIVDGDAVVVMIQNSSAANAMDYVVQFRMLYKLH